MHVISVKVPFHFLLCFVIEYFSLSMSYLAYLFLVPLLCSRCLKLFDCRSLVSTAFFECQVPHSFTQVLFNEIISLPKFVDLIIKLSYENFVPKNLKEKYLTSNLFLSLIREMQIISFHDLSHIWYYSGFPADTKLAILTLLPTLYSHKFAVSFI